MLNNNFLVHHKHKARNFIVFNVFIFILKADEFFSYEKENGVVSFNYVKENIVLEIKFSTKGQLFNVNIQVKRHNKKIIYLSTVFLFQYGNKIDDVCRVPFNVYITPDG
jgi:hypothetical protein